MFPKKTTFSDLNQTSSATDQIEEYIKKCREVKVFLGSDKACLRKPLSLHALTKKPHISRDLLLSICGEL
jgi:hypothetical protein